MLLPCFQDNPHCPVTAAKASIKSASCFCYTPQGDNHFTDCRVYASAAADICGVRTIGLYDANEDAAEETPHKKSSWINGY